jgi:hypothetical protein
VFLAIEADRTLGCKQRLEEVAVPLEAAGALVGTDPPEGGRCSGVLPLVH